MRKFCLVVVASSFTGCGSGATVDPPVVCATDDVPTPLRRLSHSQYLNAIEELFGADFKREGDDSDGSDGPYFGSELGLPREIEINGFENNAAVQTPSPTLIESYHRNALSISAIVVNGADLYVGCDVFDAATCARPYLERLAFRAYRRPLTENEKTELAEFYDAELAATTDPLATLQLGIQFVLQSPQFLYMPESAGGSSDLACKNRDPLTSYEVASRLALFLWDSIPDQQLLDAAGAGELSTRASVESHARRMLQDDRAIRSVLNFHRQWLGFDAIRALNMIPEYVEYPAWHQRMPTYLLREARSFVKTVVFDRRGTLADLLTETRSEGNAVVAAHYGASHPLGAPTPALWEEEEELSGFDDPLLVDIRPFDMPASERAGILTLAGPNAALSHAFQPAPVQRGLFVLRQLLCAPPPAPPSDVDITPPEIEDDGPLNTNRDRYAAHTDNPACRGCHESIDNIGFTFENYDHLGRYRSMDDGFPVDASGATRIDGATVSYANAVEFAKHLAASKQVHDCVATQWFRYAMGRTESAGDQAELDHLGQSLLSGGGGIQDLLVAIVASDSFRSRGVKQ